jgi:hypothetical protein
MASKPSTNFKPLPTLLSGEDRSFGGDGLYVDLVPQRSWFSNVRSHVAPRERDRLGRHVYRRADFRCEVCGAAGSLQAHERWRYEDAVGAQTLIRLICLCEDCHTATHFGLARVLGKDPVAMRHLCKVNRWTPLEAEAHVEGAFAEWRQRSMREWRLDMGIVERCGIQIRR